MSSVVELWNLALSHIGAEAVVLAQTEKSEEASRCALEYPTARRLALRAHKWGFARKVAPLADMGTPPNGWGYRYRYPGDCVFARAIDTGQRELVDAIPFEVSWDEAAGRVVLTDQATADLVYTADVTDPNAWDILFFDALGWLLASRLALSITKSRQIRSETFRIYQETLAEAQVAERNESEPDVEREAPSIRARG